MIARNVFRASEMVLTEEAAQKVRNHVSCHIERSRNVLITSCVDPSTSLRMTTMGTFWAASSDFRRITNFGNIDYTYTKIFNL